MRLVADLLARHADHDVLVDVAEALGLGQRGVGDGAEDEVADEDPDHRDHRDPEERFPEAGHLSADEEADEDEDRVEAERAAHEARLEPVHEDRLDRDEDDRHRDRGSAGEQDGTDDRE